MYCQFFTLPPYGLPAHATAISIIAHHKHHLQAYATSHIFPHNLTPESLFLTPALLTVTAVIRRYLLRKENSGPDLLQLEFGGIFLPRTEGPERRTSFMRLLLTNCPECHVLMVRTSERDVCKVCFAQRHQSEDADDSAALTEEKSSERASRCRTCRREIETGDMFCLRCTLKLVRMSRESVSALQDKLKRFPALRGRDKPFAEGSRSHVQDVIPGGRRQSRKSSSFTPSTKYSS